MKSSSKLALVALWVLTLKTAGGPLKAVEPPEGEGQPVKPGQEEPGLVFVFEDVDFHSRYEYHPEIYNVEELLAFDGPSTQALETLPSPVVHIMDFYFSEEAEKVIDRLLSAEDIPYNLKDFRGSRRQVAVVTVPKSRYVDAMSLFLAAAEEERLEKVEDEMEFITW